MGDIDWLKEENERLKNTTNQKEEEEKEEQLVPNIIFIFSSIVGWSQSPCILHLRLLFRRSIIMYSFNTFFSILKIFFSMYYIRNKQISGPKVSVRLN